MALIIDEQLAGDLQKQGACPLGKANYEVPDEWLALLEQLDRQPTQEGRQCPADDAARDDRSFLGQLVCRLVSVARSSRATRSL